MTKLVRFGFAVDGLHVDGVFYLGVLPDMMTAFLTIEHEPEPGEQGCEFAEGKVVIALPGKEFHLQLIRLAH